MKKSVWVLTTCGLLGLFLSACNLGVVAPATEPPLVVEPAGEGVQAGEGDAAAALPPIDMSGVPAGTTMMWYDNSLLVFVPGGEFTMGGDMPDNPVHTVQVDDLWAYKTKVTNDMYRLCVAAGACTPPGDEQATPAYLQPELKDHPVVEVTWEQADAYCSWMSARLPTEAEWEKIARGPEGNLYPWGLGAPNCDLLNYETCALASTSRVYDYPDGQSYYTAADMAGNTHEWVADWYGSNYYEVSPEENPPGPEQGTQRSVRGSSFRTTQEELASSRRYGFEPGKQRDDLGFRCVVAGDAFGFPPFCQITAHVPGLSLPFDEIPPSGEAGEYTPPESHPCLPVPPDVSVRSYCVDREAGTGGANVTYSGELRDLDPGCADGGDPIVCTGPEGATLSITVCTFCVLFSELPEDIEPECAAGYDFVDGMCEYSGIPPFVPPEVCPPGWFPDPDTGLCKAALPLPDSDLCPEGYSYYEPMACCLAAFTDPFEGFPGIPPHSYPGCPLGTDYDDAAGLCVPEGFHLVTEHCRDFPVELGYCAEPGDEPGDDDGTCVDPVGCAPPPNCGGATGPPCCCP